MLVILRLSEAQHSNGSHHRVWQRRFYVFNVRTGAKCNEKLEYMHANPVKARLTATPTDWRWSSARYHAGFDKFDIPMDRFD